MDPNNGFLLWKANTMTKSQNTPARVDQNGDMMAPNFLHEKYAVADARLNVCKSCSEYVEATTQCKQCGCFMRFKTMLPNAKCPLSKWGN